MSMFLAGVADARIFRNDELFATAKTLVDSSISIGVSAEDIRAGKGAKLYGKYFHTSTFDLKMNDAMFKLEYIAANVGADLQVGGEVFKTKEMIGKDLKEYSFTDAVPMISGQDTYIYVKPVRSQNFISYKLSDDYKITDLFQQGKNLFDMKTILPEQGWSEQEDGSFYVENNSTVSSKVLWENTDYNYTGQIKILYQVKFAQDINIDTVNIDLEASGSTIAIVYADGLHDLYPVLALNANTWKSEEIISDERKTVEKIVWYAPNKSNSTWVKDIMITKDITTTTYEPYFSIGDETETYCVEYLYTNDNARKLVVNANFTPDTVSVYLDANLYSGDAENPSTGTKIGSITIKVPRFLLNGTQELSMSMTGASQTPLEGSALATQAEGCDGEGIYAEIIEVVDGYKWLDNIDDIIINEASDLKGNDDILIYAKVNSSIKRIYPLSEGEIRYTIIFKKGDADFTPTNNKWGESDTYTVIFTYNDKVINKIAIVK